MCSHLIYILIILFVVLITEVAEEKDTKGSISSYQKNVQESLQNHPLQFKFTIFTVASLQQYTNSFSEQNLMRQTLFGKIYLAEQQDIKVSNQLYPEISIPFLHGLNKFIS